MLQPAEHLLLGFTSVQQSPAKQNANILHRSLGSRLWAGQSRVQITAEIRYSFLQNVQIGSGPHPDSYSVDTGAVSPQANWAGMGFATHLKVVSRLRMSGGAEPPHLNLIYLHSTCR